MTGSSEDHYDVAVVGLGPVGLALARLLGESGVRVAAIDPNRIVCQHPRATHIDDETMRMLQTLGAADLEQGYLAFAGMDFIDADSHAFMRLDMPTTMTDQAWRADYQTHQPDVESRLRGGLSEDPHVDLLLGWKLDLVEQSDDDVTLHLAERGSADVRTITAGYLVGADGAGSFVRSSLGVAMEDLHGTQRSLIVDILPFEPSPDLDPTSGFFLCDAENPLTYLPIYPPLQRFELMLRDEDDAHELEAPAFVYSLLSPWHRPGSYRILRSDVYQWHASIAERWRDRRVFLAGDAAHLMPPMLGQGMCSGLRDAFNLAWKLARVISGRSDTSLLETYESERSPAVRPYVAESARQANLIEAFAHAENRPPAGPPMTVQRYRPPLGPGLLRESAGASGQLSPQGVGDDGVRFDDRVGYNFAVLGDAETIGSVAEATRRVWADLDAVVLTDESEVVRSWLAAEGARAAIVRPDRYAFGLAPDAPGLDVLTAELIVGLAATPAGGM